MAKKLQKIFSVWELKRRTRIILNNTIWKKTHLAFHAKCKAQLSDRGYCWRSEPREPIVDQPN